MWRVKQKKIESAWQKNGMFHNLLFIGRCRLVVTGGIFLLASTGLNAQLPLPANQQITEQEALLSKQNHEQLIPYQAILKKTEKEYLWLENGRLTLPGLTLHWLLADLGWHDLINTSDLSVNNYRRHDRFLTRGFLELIGLDYNRTSASPGEASILIDAINNDSTDSLLASLLPQYEQITLLRKAISQYRILSRYPWPLLDVNFKPKLGQSHPQVKGIRKILTRLGDMPNNAQSRQRLNVFDSVVVAALKKFQHRHGLLVDGKLGPNTYAALQVSPEQRIKQLQVNLWRWFTLPKRPPEKYLQVNIPSYQLTVMEAGQRVLQMKVIVGKSENPTPQMNTRINRLTLNPTWTPTVNITKNELIPEYEKDYLSLQRQNFRLVKGHWKSAQSREIDQPNLNLSKLLQSYRLVQAPGDNNALGYYRFNIPNNQSIYLHDTPAKSLFKRSQRALSHGCVRLENAELLAKYLLRSEARYDEQQMSDTLKSGKTTHVTLTASLPVYITYQTAWINKQGELRFSEDVYSLDQQSINLTQFQALVSNSVLKSFQNTL